MDSQVEKWKTFVVRKFQGLYIVIFKIRKMMLFKK